MKTPGIDVRPLREITGETLFNEVFLDDVFVADRSFPGVQSDKSRSFALSRGGHCAARDHAHGPEWWGRIRGVGADDGNSRLVSSLQALADAMAGPEWVRDLGWRVAAGLMSGDEAVAIILDEYPRRRIARPSAEGLATR
jgi:hypothetical protein